ncbi:hypothetical protein D3873_09725 [Paenisporosarcina cavernae]|uniref:DUF2798 domain-containing protein n=1 Tax=Paenisporosarcina cavernae TaxID=2320858 RepID=A0A385YWT0_9BACL|nr:hypothetical protein D3873_09725 [Paenisporosarcina cavernae]
MKVWSFLIGSCIGVIVGFLSVFIFTYVGNVLAGGITSFQPEPFLYIACIFPFSIACGVLAHYLSSSQFLTSAGYWKMSFIFAFVLSIFVSTFGVLIGEYVVRGGVGTLNWSGTILWGLLYAILLLPLSASLVKLFLLPILQQAILLFRQSRFMSNK